MQNRNRLKKVTTIWGGGGGIISQRTTVIRWLILYNPTNYGVLYVFRGVSHLSLLPRKSRGIVIVNAFKKFQIIENAGNFLSSL